HVAFTPDGRWLITDDQDSGALRDPRTGRLVRSVAPPPSAGIVFSVRLFDDGRLLTGAVDRKFNVWDAATGQLRARLGGAGYHCFFAPNGKLAATTEALSRGETSV